MLGRSLPAFIGTEASYQQERDLQGSVMGCGESDFATPVPQREEMYIRIVFSNSSWKKIGFSIFAEIEGKTELRIVTFK